MAGLVRMERKSQGAGARPAPYAFYGRARRNEYRTLGGSVAPVALIGNFLSGREEKAQRRAALGRNQNQKEDLNTAGTEKKAPEGSALLSVLSVTSVSPLRTLC